MLLRASWIGLVGMASFASTLVVVVVDPAVASKTPIKPNEGAWFSFPVKAFDSKSPQKYDINVHVAPHDAAAVTEDVANKASDAAAAGQPAIASIHFETTPPSGPNPGNAVSFVVSGAVTDAKTTSGSIAMVCDSKSCRRKVEGTDASSQPCKIVKIGRRVVVRGGCGQFTFYAPEINMKEIQVVSADTRVKAYVTCTLHDADVKKPASQASGLRRLKFSNGGHENGHGEVAWALVMVLAVDALTLPWS